MPGPSIAALHLAVPAEAWAALGFAVDGEGVSRIGATELRLGHAGSGIVGWTLRDAAGEGDVDGLATERTDGGGAAEAAAPVHPIGATSVDHVVVMTPDIDRTLAALRATGMVLRREREMSRAEPPMRQGFFRHGEAIVEVVGPREVDPAGGPATFWGLTLTVADLDVAAQVLGDRLGTPRDAVQPGRRIATVRREAGLGIPLALMSAEPTPR